VSGIGIDLAVSAVCIRCRVPRDLDGRLIAEGESTMVVEAPTACPCGERRLKVAIGLDVQEDAGRPEDEGRSSD
jgi:hypothetical protein